MVVCQHMQYRCQDGFQYRFVCGRCMPCRIRTRQEWTLRAILEARLRGDSSFTTLTYRPGEEPVSVLKEDFQKFMRRLRKIHSRERRLGRTRSASKLRFFGVGEYGDERGRPHYHALLFGLPAVSHSKVMVEEAWNGDRKRGFTHTTMFTPDRAQYVARYTTKKLSKELWESVHGSSQTQPFALMSRRPGVAAGYCTLVAQSVAQSAYWKDLERATLQDPSIQNLSSVSSVIPRALRVALPELPKGKVYPLSRYMRNRIAEELCVNINLEEKKFAILSNMLQSSDPFEDSVLEAEKVEATMREVARAERKRGVL